MYGSYVFNTIETQKRHKALRCWHQKGLDCLVLVAGRTDAWRDRDRLFFGLPTTIVLQTSVILSFLSVLNHASWYHWISLMRLTKSRPRTDNNQWPRPAVLSTPRHAHCMIIQIYSASPDVRHGITSCLCLNPCYFAWTGPSYQHWRRVDRASVSLYYLVIFFYFVTVSDHIFLLRNHRFKSTINQYVSNSIHSVRGPIAASAWGALYPAFGSATRCQKFPPKW